MTVTLPVLWVGTMQANGGPPFEVRVLSEFGDDKLILLTDDWQLWCMSRSVVKRKT